MTWLVLLKMGAAVQETAVGKAKEMKQSNSHLNVVDHLLNLRANPGGMSQTGYAPS